MMKLFRSINFVVLLFLFPLVGASDEPISNLLSEKMPVIIQKFLGFGLVEPFYFSLLVGFSAAFILWAFYLILKIIRSITSRGNLNAKDYEEFREKQTVWFNIVVGRFWKVIVFAFFYATLMQIPLINRATYFLTLSFLDNFFIKVFMICFWIGFLPGFIENFWKEVYVNKLKKDVWDAQKVRAITKQQARIISDFSKN